VVVAAAGNQGTSTPIYPGAWNNTIAVAAIDSTAVLADFSCFGGHIDVCAPGTNIYSTYLDNGYAWWSGTSFATPFVTAQAALALSLSPTPTWSQVTNAVATTAVNIDEPNANHVGMIGSGLCSPTGAVEWLSAVCGDVDGNGEINILDLTQLIDYLWLGGPPVNPAVVESLDGVAGITNHDMYALADYMYYSFDPLTCEITADAFPSSPDILMFAGVAVPADRSLWMVDVWVNILDPYYGVAAAFAYDCPTSVIVLDTIIWQTDAGLIEAYLVDNTAQKVALVVNELTEAPPTGGYRHLATLGFTVTPSSEPQVINFELTQYPFSESDHVTVISKPGADSLEGVVPQLQSMEERMGVAEVATVSPNVLNFTGDPNTFSFLRKTAWLSSTKAPAHYVGRKISTGNDFIFFEDSTHYTYDSISGQTDDSIYIVVVPSQAPGPGLYVDSILFEVEGVDDLVLLTVKVVLESSAPAACCDMVGDVNGNGIAYEIHDAVALGNAVLTGDTSFIQPCLGNADINADCWIDITDLVYMEAVMHGDSLPVAECNSCPSYVFVPESAIPTAAVNPDTLYASFPEDIELLVAPTVYTWLTSTNAPAYYSPEMVSAEPIFAWVDTSGGWTNDSVVVTLNPNPGPVGTYYNTILFHVDGVTDPAELTVCLTVTPPDTLSYASITPEVMNFYGDPYTYSFLTKVGWLSSTNAPATYLGTKKTPGNDFIFFEDSTQYVYDSIHGQTNDSIVIVVIPSQSPGPGQYIDSILFEVDGVMDPVLLVVNVTLDSMGQAACCELPGDVDGDGIAYTPADANTLETVLATRDMTPILSCPGNADVTTDCVIDYADLSYINSVVMGWGPVPPLAECGSCISYTLGTTPTVAIQSLQQVQLGEPASVAVTLDNWGVGIGGFELLFNHDANVLNFLNAVPGPEFFDLTPAGCGWEYFTYQLDANGIRVVGVADLNNGEVHPVCTMASPLPATLFTLEFMTTEDRTYLGQNTRIDFRWVECGDNAFSSVSGENLYLDRAVYNADGFLIWDELD
ncbi:MAG: S8 family serine peptidase, partial [Planctomycetota bacterium]